MPRVLGSHATCWPLADIARELAPSVYCQLVNFWNGPNKGDVVPQAAAQIARSVFSSSWWLSSLLPSALLTSSWFFRSFYASGDLYDRYTGFQLAFGCLETKDHVWVGQSVPHRNVSWCGG